MSEGELTEQHFSDLVRKLRMLDINQLNDLFERLKKTELEQVEGTIQETHTDDEEDFEEIDVLLKNGEWFQIDYDWANLRQLLKEDEQDWYIFKDVWGKYWFVRAEEITAIKQSRR